MKVTVCEFRNDTAQLEQDWKNLVAHVEAEASELILLPEMPFYPWMAWTNDVDPAYWKSAVEAHEKWISRFEELSSAIILGTRPVLKNDTCLNQGYIWEKAGGYRDVHTKYYLPNESGFWEATWYERGEYEFSPVESNNVKAGFLICTELWFTQHARYYGKEGIQILVCPRATPRSSADKWVAGGRAAAVISGAFCLSSNRGGIDSKGMEWAGTGWIIEPEEGNVLGLTSQETPFLTIDIDLKIADAAKKTYPRYVLD